MVGLARCSSVHHGDNTHVREPDRRGLDCRGTVQESEDSMISFLHMIPHEVEGKGCDAASLPQNDHSEALGARCGAHELDKERKQKA